MIATTKAYNIIKRFEGFRNRAYKCSAGVWTVGYGHTRNVTQSTTVTEERATELLHEDIVECELFLNKEVKVQLTSNQFDALVSFVFNIGGKNFRNSTLLRLLNEGKYDTVPTQMMRWRFANHKEIKGLRNRREVEAKLFQEK